MSRPITPEEVMELLGDDVSSTAFYIPSNEVRPYTLCAPIDVNVTEGSKQTNVDTRSGGDTLDQTAFQIELTYCPEPSVWWSTIEAVEIRGNCTAVFGDVEYEDRERDGYECTVTLTATEVDIE